MLTRLRLENFKSWKDTGDIDLKPITGFFGPNSSGKTSLFQALLLMKQTDESPNRGIMFHFGDETTPVNLGDFESIIHRHDAQHTLKFSLGWKSKREIRIPDTYGQSVVANGDDVAFEVELKQFSMGSRKSMELEEMAYRIAGRQFGLRRLPRWMEYELYARGSDIDFSRVTEGDSIYFGHPIKFHHFPYGWYGQGRDLLFDLQHGLTLLLRDLHYLGPLRAHPNRTYSRSGARPIDMGPSGESTVDALLLSKELDTRITVLEHPQDAVHPYHSPFDEHIARWLGRLGLAHSFWIEELAEGRQIFEVKVRKSPDSAATLLTDIGFGVSQVLPVLVQCFYANHGSTVILEQPDIHLHPAAQAGLADLFIAAKKSPGVQILFESHSEHLLRRLQRRIAEEKIPQEDVALYFCSSNPDGSSSLSRLEVDEFGLISNWPRDFFGDQFGEIAAMSEAALKRQGRSE